MNKSNFNDMLSRDEKQQLRKRIMQSALLVKKRKSIKRFYFAAASVVFFIGIAIFIQFSSQESLEEYVGSAPAMDIKAVDGVTLILGSGDNLNLDEENMTIEYSDTGEEVKLGSGKTVKQKTVKNNESLFNTILVPYGKRTDLRLSDGTIVWLNSGSKMIYPAVFTGETREVFLEGEAIFDVTHNAQMPFKVRSSHQEIEVLGTVFNVNSYQDDKLKFTVLKSGSVQINYSDKEIKGVRLKPGTLASYNPETKEAVTKEVNINNFFSWKDGFLNFEKDNLEFIMTKLSRYYNVEIEIANEELANQTFSGHLDLKEDVEKVLGLIRETSNFNMDKSPKGKILITNQTN